MNFCKDFGLRFGSLRMRICSKSRHFDVKRRLPEKIILQSHGLVGSLVSTFKHLLKHVSIECICTKYRLICTFLSYDRSKLLVFSLTTHVLLHINFRSVNHKIAINTRIIIKLVVSFILAYLRLYFFCKIYLPFCKTSLFARISSDSTSTIVYHVYNTILGFFILKWMKIVIFRSTYRIIWQLLFTNSYLVFDILDNNLKTLWYHLDHVDHLAFLKLLKRVIMVDQQPPC